MTRLSAQIASTERGTPRSWPSRVSRMATIGALVGASWLAWRALQFHVPASLIDALLPRL